MIRSENMNVLYIENEDNTDTDKYIRTHFRAIYNEFRLAGLNFVYIPHIVYDYQQMHEGYIPKVIRYMIPNLDDSKTRKIQHDLCSMTTSRFTYELLFKKMGINVLNCGPSLLFKIGESSVADCCGVEDLERVMYSNFLLVPINQVGKFTDMDGGRSILDFIVELMDSYRSMVSNKLIIQNQPLSEKFRYHGFHRSLFDLIAYGKERNNYKLVINLKNRNNSVVLRPIDATPSNVVECEEDLIIDLAPQPCSLYILMIYMSLVEGYLDWTDYPFNNERRKLLLKKYNAIYKNIGKGSSSTSYREKSHVSRIKKELLAHSPIVTNIDLFIPNKVVLADVFCYKVPVPPDLIYVIEGTKGKEKEIKMVDSEFWKSKFWLMS